MDYKFFWFILFFLFVNVNSEESIILNNINTVKLDNKVSDDLVSDIIYQLYKRRDVKPLYLFINSSGGDVKSGNQLIDFIQYYSMDTDLICISNYAASMAFAILQSCKKRYGTKKGVLMQHQIIFKNNDNGISFNELQRYMDYISSLNKEFISFQSERIGMNKDDFFDKTSNDWWLTTKQALEYKMIDKLVIVGCDNEYAMANHTVSLYRTKYTVINTYSNCPLIDKPIDTKYIFDQQSDSN